VVGLPRPLRWRPRRAPAPGWRARAETSGWELDPTDHRLLGLLDEIARPASEVLVVTDRRHERLARLVPSGQVLETAAVSPHLLRIRLAIGPRPDLIVLDTEDPARRRRLVTWLAFLVPRGGSLVVARVREAATADDSTLRYVAGLLDHEPGEQPPPGVRAADIPHLRAGWREVRLAGNHLVLSNDLRTYIPLLERETNQALARRPRLGRVLATVPGGDFGHRGELRESESRVAGRWPAAYDVPELSLREYADVVCRPGGIVISGHTLLPDTHRHIARPRPSNRFVPTLSPTAARLRSRIEPEREILGPHFYWDSEFRGHFGHVMTEMLSRLWALDAARRHHRDLRILMATSPNKESELTDHEIAILGAFGVRPAEITFLRGPARVRTLLAATPMFSQPQVVHPGLSEVWDRLGSHLAEQAPARFGEGDYPRRLFVARRGTLRRCRNAAQVESLFATHGFEVVHPEDHPLPVQARLFREAETIAGYAGSGLFNALLAETPKRIVMISSESYTVQNEWMIAAIRGHEVDVAWARPEVGHEAAGTRAEAFHSAYSVDFEREGLFLRKVLADL